MIIRNDDKDKDGFISYEEFSGPKGPAKPSKKQDESKTPKTELWIIMLHP